MIKIVICILTVVFLSPQLFSQKLNPSWELVTRNTKWNARDSQGGLVFKNRLWILGGWFNSYEAPPRDIWSSANGKDWKLVEKAAPWVHSDLAMSVTFKNRMWIMGGWYNGRLPGHSASNSVWSSSDGMKWSLITRHADWSPRLGAMVITFKGKLWLLGGTEDYYFGNEKSLKNDVWYSADGKNWKLALRHAPWSARAYLQAVVLDGKIYVMGGGNYEPKYFALNDVWCSEDGIHWEKVSDHAPWHERIWFSAVVYRDCIWIMGGWSDNPSRNWADIWYSKDGKNWKKYLSTVTWGARHALSAFVFHDKLWVAGGNTYPLVNDVWSLDLPSDW